MRRKTRNRGLTLIELMMTLVILTIVMMMAAPSFRTYLANQNVKGTTHKLIAVIRYARSEAVNRNANVSVVAADGGWADGWRVVEGVDVLTRNDTPNPNWSITESGGATSLTFNRAGRLLSGVTFKVCDTESNSLVKRRVVQVSTTGLPVIKFQGDCGDGG